ncbi:hypothetical protein F5Y18DRAFT_93025 [Xylariaceae sp. FL1019]|nr:hypothetical protein F5Y18DRAFT_93025 [Xylariaceae sp. FL1019]
MGSMEGQRWNWARLADWTPGDRLDWLKSLVFLLLPCCTSDYLHSLGCRTMDIESSLLILRQFDQQIFSHSPCLDMTAKHHRVFNTHQSVYDGITFWIFVPRLPR